MSTDLVIIEWLDSRQPNPGWRHLSSAMTWGSVKCTSVGWLVYDGADHKVLVQNMADIDDADNLQISGDIVIPACCVLSVKKLQEIEV